MWQIWRDESREKVFVLLIWEIVVMFSVHSLENIHTQIVNHHFSSECMYLNKSFQHECGLLSFARIYNISSIFLKDVCKFEWNDFARASLKLLIHQLLLLSYVLMRLVLLSHRWWNSRRECRMKLCVYEWNVVGIGKTRRYFCVPLDSK